MKKNIERGKNDKMDTDNELKELLNDLGNDVKTDKDNNIKTDDIEIQKEKEKLFDEINLSHKSLKKLLQNGYSKMDNWIIHHMMDKNECAIKNISQFKLWLFLYKQTKGFSGRNKWKIDMNKMKSYTGFEYKKINYGLNKLYSKGYIDWNKKENTIQIITDFPAKTYKKINKGFIPIPDYLLYALIWNYNGINSLYEMMIILYFIKMVFGYRQTKNHNKVYFDNDGKRQNKFERQVIGDYQKIFYLKDGWKNVNEYTGIADKDIYKTKKLLIDNGIISIDKKDMSINITFNIDIRNWNQGDYIYYHLKEKKVI